MRRLDELTVHVPTLGEHAARLDAIAVGVQTAADIGDRVRLDTAAYGQLLVDLPAALNVLQGFLSDAIGTAGEAISETAARIRAAASAYTDSDATVEHTYSILGGPR